MCQLNKIGAQFALIDGVKAITDVTGFGLLGHLTEICEGSGVAAVIDYDAVPKLDQIDHYLDQDCSPGGAQRNYDSYGHKIGELTKRQRQLLCDPQTSGGLAIAVKEKRIESLVADLKNELSDAVIGRFVEDKSEKIIVSRNVSETAF